MLKKIRQELLQAFAEENLPRTPFLRRSDDPSWLLVSDWPRLSRTVPELLSRPGWRWEVRDGLLWMDNLPEKPERHPQVQAAGETGCLLSLLRRHPRGTEEPVMIRRLLKLMDSPKQERERGMARVHGELAERLRLRQPLPDLLPWLELELFLQETER